MRVTIKKLAAELKISPATVSLALHDDPRIPDCTKSQVKKLADEWAYVPNNFGRGLQAGKSCLAGYLANSFTGSFYDIILQGIGETAAVANYGLLAAITSYDPDIITSQLRIFLEKNVDGVIIAVSYSNMKSAMKMIESRQIPAVFCSTQDSGSHPHVATDNFAGGQLAARHLIELGHKYFACCSAEPGRLRGNLDAIKKAGLPPPLIFKSGEELTTVFKKKKVTGIIAYSDMQAIKLKHLANCNGLRIPEDISIVGFDDLWFAQLEEFNFTTIAQPKDEIGRVAMNLLLKLIATGDCGNILLKPELIVRGSAAVPEFYR
jgi:DNA-binding LacI/PurR family transcriptional regulator